MGNTDHKTSLQESVVEEHIISVIKKQYVANDYIIIIIVIIIIVTTYFGYRATPCMYIRSCTYIAT